MAELIKEIDNLPLKEQEMILKQLSDNFVPIQINDEVFMIPEEVDLLISGLNRQIEEMKDKVCKD